MAAPSVTYTFVNGAIADASQVNQNFTDLVNALTDTSIDASIGSIALSDASADAVNVPNGGITSGYDAIGSGVGGLRFAGSLVSGNGHTDASGYGTFLGVGCKPSSTSTQVDATTVPCAFIAVDANVTAGCAVTFGQKQDASGDTAPEDTMTWGADAGSGLKCDLYSGSSGWVDWSASANTVGWSGSPTVSVFYKRVGKLLFVNFSITGTSDTTGATFDLPTGYYPAAGCDVLTTGFGVDNTTALTAPIVISYTNAGGGPTITLYKAYPTAAWTASGTKTVTGQFWFQMALSLIHI